MREIGALALAAISRGTCKNLMLPWHLPATSSRSASISLDLRRRAARRALRRRQRQVRGGGAGARRRRRRRAARHGGAVPHAHAARALGAQGAPLARGARPLVRVCAGRWRGPPRVRVCRYASAARTLDELTWRLQSQDPPLTCVRAWCWHTAARRRRRRRCWRSPRARLRSTCCSPRSTCSTATGACGTAGTLLSRREYAPKICRG